MSSPMPSVSPSRGRLTRGLLWFIGVIGLTLAVIPHVLVGMGYLDLTAMLHEASFYVMVGVYIFVASVLVWVCRSERWLVAHAYRHRWAIVLIFLATAALFGVVGPGFRVLSDETNLLSVSRSMLRDKSILNNIMSYYYLDIFHHLRSVTDKRPFAFPFAIYLVHVLTGYRYQNLFVTNYLITSLTMAFLYLLVRWRASRAYGIGVLLLCLAQPILLICGTSGGFESMALLCQLSAYVTMLAYMRRPSAALFFAMVSSWVMFINTRYESIAVVAVLGVGMLLTQAAFRRHLWRYVWSLPWVVVSVAPIFWLFRLKGDDQETKNGAAAFHVDYFREHLRDMAVAFFRMDFYFPFAPLISLAFLLVAGVAVWRYRGAIRSMNKAWWLKAAPWVAIVLSLAVQTAIYLAYHVGSPEFPYAVRYFLPFAVMLTLGGGLIAMRLRVPGQVIFGLGLTAFFLYMPVVIENRFMETLELPRETKRIYRFLADKPKHETLVISDRPGQYVVLDIGAVNFKHANQDVDTLTRQIKERVFSQVYAIQEINPQSDVVSPETELNARYTLTPVYEILSSHDHVTRISRVGVAPLSSPPPLLRTDPAPLSLPTIPVPARVPGTPPAR